MSGPFLIGCATTFLKAYSVSEALDTIARCGYAAAEVWIEHLENTGESPQALARQAKSLGLILTVHAASYDLNPTSSNLGIALESSRQIEASLATSAELGAKLVVVHPGRRSSSRDRLEDFWPKLIGWVADLDQAADRLGVDVGLELMENRPKEIFMLPEHATQLMETDWKKIRLTIDVAHMNTYGDAARYLRDLNPAWIAHVHLSDNAPWQTHLPLGTGELDIPAVLYALQEVYTGIVSLEGYVLGKGESLLKQNMAYLKQIGFA
jgi:sugar phosphate isomerase/epimerase